MTLLRVRCTCRGRCLVGVFVGLVVFLCVGGLNVCCVVAVVCVVVYSVCG
jgi:hypothetical protein